MSFAINYYILISEEDIMSIVLNMSRSDYEKILAHWQKRRTENKTIRDRCKNGL